MRENGSRPARACASRPGADAANANALRASTSEMIVDTIQRALDPHHDGQSHHDVSIGHQQIVCSDLGIAVTVLDCTGLHPMSETR